MNARFPDNDALAKLVAEARSVSTPEVSVTAQDIQQAVQAEGRVRYLRWGMALAAAAAVVLAISWFGGDRPEQETSVTNRVAVTTPEQESVESTPAQLVQQPNPVTPHATEPSPESKPPAPPMLALAEGVHVRTESGPEPIVVSRWQVEVSAGVYRIDVEPTVESTVTVRYRDRTLEVEPGAVLVLDHGRLNVEAGQARWQDETKPDKPSAAALAKRAEQEMAGGDRAAAIKTLTKLARLHPRASETRTGLVDLARLRAAAGNQDHARCAYELALARWPGASIAPDIQRALDRMGEGRKCKGLRPL